MHRFALLDHHQRWALIQGHESSFASDRDEDAWRQAYDLHRDALLAEVDDIADDLDGFGKHDPAVPDELRSSRPTFLTPS